MRRPLNLQFQKLEGTVFTNENATDNIGLYNTNTGRFYNGKLISTKNHGTEVMIEKNGYTVPLKHHANWYYMNTSIETEGDDTDGCEETQ